MTVFAGYPPAVPDPILNLNALFAADSNPKKVNLGVGAYRDETGKPWILPSVREAEKVISADLTTFNKEYPPMAGFPKFLEAAQRLMFGADSPVLQQGRVASCQAISGSGSLYIGFQLIHHWLKSADVYLPAPTWPNHYSLFNNVFGDSGRKYKEYPYLRAGSLEIDLEGALQVITKAPRGSVFLFHACAHNPSGIDYTVAQWDKIRDAIKAHGHVVFFDSAYQGFATGSFEDDARAVRDFVAAGVDVLVAQSFSKNFGLYGERVGCIHVVHGGAGSEAENKQLSAALTSGLASLVRATWSLSAIHGAYIVQTIVHDPHLLKMFYADVATMSGRIRTMRQRLHAALSERRVPGPGPSGGWDHLVSAIGMFTYTGLAPEHVDYLREKWSIYMVKSGGRMSMCGLTDANIDYVAEAIADAIAKFPLKK
ncbi:Aspartate aminotransferase [Giardia muris]|uniref:Aspartate aminotransferase n=1 Tax=Giardia muris TaxID=5742 RepID=A0A4Z1T3G2_GIAMU|nr:Aspartate aminotransferase [Giardia muris]|eukprot:TNJ28493.1 Aspartate aminotransferase [Giardia muris]